MLALASTLARTDTRRRSLVLGVCAFGLAGALIAIATRPSDSYPVLSGAVRNLVYLGPALMAHAAWPAARAAESGMARELFLCGISSKQRRRATALVVVGATSVIWLAGSAIAAGLAALWLWPAGDSVVLVRQGGSSVAWWAAIGLSSSVLLGLVGCACGCVCRTRAAAVAIVALLGGASLLLALLGEFPPALWLRSLSPGGALDAVFNRRDDIRGEAWLRWGVPAIYLLGSAWLVAMGRRASDPVDYRRGGEASPLSGAVAAHGDPVVLPRASRLAAAAPVALLLAAAVALGAVAPQRIARAIPWWLHGAWVEDLARNRASAPVVRAYVAAVRSGDERRERQFALGGRDEVLDPVLRAAIRRARRVLDVEYAYSSDERPGSVHVTLGSASPSLDLTVCNVRRRDGWRVVRVVSNRLC